MAKLARFIYDSHISLQIHEFAHHVCYLMSSWIVLCMTLERFIAVNFPFKKDLFCKPRNALTTIFVVFAIMSYSQIFRLIAIEKSEKHRGCSSSKKYQKIYVAMHIYLYQLILQFMLPALLILILNMSILFKIQSLKDNVSKHGTAHSVRAYSKRNKTTCMLLIVSFTYVVTLLPLVVVSILLDISILHNKSLARKLFYNLYNVSAILELISEVNYAVNFFIYVISGAQFRQQLKKTCERNERHYYIPASSPAPTERIYRRSITKKPSNTIWQEAHHNKTQDDITHRKLAKNQSVLTIVSHVWYG